MANKFSYEPLFRLLKERGMKQKTLAHKANISHATVTKLKRNEIVISDILERICSVLHCTFNDIMTLVVDETPSDIRSNESVNSKTNDYDLSEVEQNIIHFIYEQINYYIQNPPVYMVNQILFANQRNIPNLTKEEAVKMIPKDRFYSLVMNEAIEKWGDAAWEFNEKHIPFNLIASGYFEEDTSNIGMVLL